jgi:hypothetical protein
VADESSFASNGDTIANAFGLPTPLLRAQSAKKMPSVSPQSATKAMHLSNIVKQENDNQDCTAHVRGCCKVCHSQLSHVGFINRLVEAEVWCVELGNLVVKRRDFEVSVGVPSPFINIVALIYHER